jgi:hypothetical protein
LYAVLAPVFVILAYAVVTCGPEAGLLESTKRWGSFKRVILSVVEHAACTVKGQKIRLHKKKISARVITR